MTWDETRSKWWNKIAMKDLAASVWFELNNEKNYLRTTTLNIVFFTSNVVIFLNSASSAAALVFYLPGVCTHTVTKGKQRKTRDRHIFEKNTIFNKHPVHNKDPDMISWE